MLRLTKSDEKQTYTILSTEKQKRRNRHKSLIRCCGTCLWGFFRAEREGFEPPDPRRSTVFKTAAIDRSAISPKEDAKVHIFLVLAKFFFVVIHNHLLMGDAAEEVWMRAVGCGDKKGCKKVEKKRVDFRHTTVYYRQKRYGWERWRFTSMEQ